MLKYKLKCSLPSLFFTGSYSCLLLFTLVRFENISLLILFFSFLAISGVCGIRGGWLRGEGWWAYQGCREGKHVEATNSINCQNNRVRGNEGKLAI